MTSPALEPTVALRRVLDGTLLCRVPELLRYATPWLPPQLDHPELLAGIQTATTPLPGAAAAAAFECPLDSEGGAVGFEICIRAWDGGRDVLVAHRRRLARARAAPPAWRRLWRCVDAWGDPASPLHEVPAVWLEFDVDGAIVAPPFPVLSLPSEPGAATMTHELVHAAVRALGGGALERETRRTLQRCLEVLDRRGRLLHVALRPSPRGPIVRLVVRLASRNVPSRIAGMGWSGSTSELAHWLDASCRDAVTQSINLDIGPTVGERVGIEYHFPTAPRNDPRWMRLLDLLVAEKACTPEWRASLTAWPSSPEPVPPSPWPPRVERALLIKVVFQTGCPLRAKAYLPFNARLVFR